MEQVALGEVSLQVVRSGGTGAAVVFVPSAFGLADDVRAQLAELAVHARVVAALDPFDRTNPGVVPYGDMPAVMARLGALDPVRARADLDAALGWARAQGPVVYVGVCFAGQFALPLAADGLVDGVVTWHGGRLDQHLHRVPEVRCPVRVHYGAIDPIIPPTAVQAVQQALSAVPDARVHVHPGATHGFTHRDAVAFDPAAEAAAMQSVIGLVRRLGAA